MPAVNPNNASQSGPQRTSFRPPWVKEGPTPLPMPSAPWTARARESSASSTADNQADKQQAPRKLSKVTIIPSQPSQSAENNVQKQEPLALNKPQIVNKKELFSQASLKRTPKPIDKETTNAVSFAPKRPSEIVKPQEGPGQSIAPGFRRKESTDKVIPVVVESSAPKEQRKSSVIQIKREPEKEQRRESVVQFKKEPEKEQKRESIVQIKKEPEKEQRRESIVQIKREPEKEQRRESIVQIKREPEKEQRRESIVQIKREPEKEQRRESIVQIKREPEKEQTKAAREFAKPIPKPVEKELPKSILKTTSKPSVPVAPKPPPAPPMAPPLPPPPPPGAGASVTKTELTPAKAAKLEALRSRPRRRPDWTDMMKEVESGQQLRHVQCNDRSAPILPLSKAKGQFLYESEKEPPNAPHKQLLSQIQTGVKLKKVKCDDRSKPNLDGLRKFRRQMTIEEQIQKSMSMADVVAAAAEPDELDDIDKVRDDLQSAKQMLAQELRNKEALERENKRLMARLLNLEVELEKEKNAKKIDAEKGTVVQARSAADEKLVQQLKDEAAEAHEMAKEMEDKYRGTAEELDATRAKLESAWLRNQQLELELKAGSRSNAPLSKQMSSKKLAASTTAMPNGKTGPESDEESEYTEETETETESEDDDSEVDAAAAQERRVARELKLLATKLRSYKDKTGTALKERRSLREHLRKQQKQLRQEKKKYKALQKEVDKMAKLMKDDEDDEEEERPEDEEEEEEETESESESEESEEEEITDGDLPEDAPVEQKRKNLTDRSKRYETRLGTLKKGNYLLKANIDRLQDDINRQREMSLNLQEDLNSVLAELG